MRHDHLQSLQPQPQHRKVAQGGISNSQVQVYLLSNYMTCLIASNFPLRTLITLTYVKPFFFPHILISCTARRHCFNKVTGKTACLIPQELFFFNVQILHSILKCFQDLTPILSFFFLLFPSFQSFVFYLKSGS